MSEIEKLRKKFCPSDCPLEYCSQSCAVYGFTQYLEDNMEDKRPTAMYKVVFRKALTPPFPIVAEAELPSIPPQHTRITLNGEYLGVVAYSYLDVGTKTVSVALE